MGEFMAMSGIAGADLQSVADALRDYANTHGGSMEQCPATEETGELLVVSAGQPGRVTVVYPDSFTGLGRRLDVPVEIAAQPVFSFHIHDGDMWIYVLHSGGLEVDQFNPIPQYWSEELS